ncbi:hypothetical protein CFP56_032229 [Quercus suber]|uniref:Uncharacterized protein n=1 Tax=Quercus suber TaxID=58331 RepID=A0AAW0LV02_QUESU
MLQSAVPSSWLHFLVPILFLLISYGTEANNKNVTGVGIIIDVSTRNRKEEKTAMQIAAQNYNSNSTTHKLALYIRDSLRVTSAEKLDNSDRLKKAINSHSMSLPWRHPYAYGDKARTKGT